MNRCVVLFDSSFFPALKQQCACKRDYNHITDMELLIKHSVEAKSEQFAPLPTGPELIILDSSRRREILVLTRLRRSTGFVFGWMVGKRRPRIGTEHNTTVSVLRQWDTKGVAPHLYLRPENQNFGLEGEEEPEEERRFARPRAVKPRSTLIGSEPTGENNAAALVGFTSVSTCDTPA